MAAELHRDQVRKGKDAPYITHLMAVAALVGSHGGDEDQAIAALLHDALEDHAAQAGDIRAEIRASFGPRVLEIVEICSDTDTTPKPPWAARKQRYIDRIHALDNTNDALLVSLCDKLHNAGELVEDLRKFGPATWERFKGGRARSLWYYRALSNLYLEKTPGPLADELHRRVELLFELDAASTSAVRAPTLYFFHGLESGPHGSKYQSLEQAFGVFSPDFQGMDIWERLQKIELETRQMRELIVVGSSYGGLLAALLYSQAPERFKGLVLMAPALHHPAAEQVERLPAEAVVIHGREDTVVPLEAVRQKCNALGVDITVVEDDHGLYASRPLMVEAVRELIVRASA